MAYELVKHQTMNDRDHSGSTAEKSDSSGRGTQAGQTARPVWNTPSVQIPEAQVQAAQQQINQVLNGPGQESAAFESYTPQTQALPYVDIEPQRRQLRQTAEEQQRQAAAKIDYQVNQSAEELRRAEADARQGFQTQRDQIAAEERRALDNQALYAEARGDRGGIGQAQTASIQNTAAQNRLKVNQAQLKLATDTARQIQDLRAKGEFQKADALLSVTQDYLTRLTQLEQWAQQTNLGVDEFNSQLKRWEAEYWQNAQKYLSDAQFRQTQLTGMLPGGTPTYAAAQDRQSQLAAAAQGLLNAGLTLTDEQREALGWTQRQYLEYLAGRGL